MAARFSARYTSRCPSCERTVNKGEEVVHVDDLVVHASCGDVFADEVAKRDQERVCQSCWQVIAPAGTCGCYENGG